MTAISGWGRFPVVETKLIEPQLPGSAQAAVIDAPSMIARGNGRA